MDRSNGSLHDILLSGMMASNLDEERYLRRIHSLKPSTREYLSLACRPEERVTYIEAENEIEVEIRLSVHNICMWDIKLEA